MVVVDRPAAHWRAEEMFSQLLGLGQSWRAVRAEFEEKNSTFVICVGETGKSWPEESKITHMVQGRAYRPAAPTNLRVFDDGAHPFYSSGQNIVLKVSQTSELRFGDNFINILPTRGTDTVIQILDLDGALKHETGFRGTIGPFTIQNALLKAALGGETDFKLRAFFYRGGLRSLGHDEITVRKA